MGFLYPVDGSVQKNLHLAREHLEMVLDKLLKEVQLGRMLGSFPSPPLANMVVSSLRIAPKKRQTSFASFIFLKKAAGQWWDRSQALFEGLYLVKCNYWLSKEVWERGPLVKTDIELAFRLLPVHLDSLHLLGCFWKGGYFVKWCLPIGCSLFFTYFKSVQLFLGVGGSGHFWLCISHPLLG